MTPATDFQSRVVSPVKCLKEGWQLIKDQYWLFLGIAVVAMLVGGAVPIVLIGPMMVGLYLCLFAKMRGEPVEFGMLFKGFDYFVQGLVAAAIQTLPALILGFGVGIVSAFLSIGLSAGQPRGAGPPAVLVFLIVILALVTMVLSLVIHMLFVFAYPLIIDRKLPGWDATVTSVRAVRGNLGGVLGLVLLNAGLSFVGFLCCFVGVYFVLPITFAAQAVAYRQVFPDVGPVNFSSPPPPPGSWAA
ncbi:MAG: hypothetical protein ACT4OT_00730 [Acidobacteriota bacterium]